MPGNLATVRATEFRFATRSIARSRNVALFTFWRVYVVNSTLTSKLLALGAFHV